MLNQIHGLSPFPGAWFKLPDGNTTIRVKLLKAELDETSHGPAGQVLDDALTIGCASGAIRPLTLQRAGKAPMERAAFLRGLSVAAGTQLGA